MVGELTETVVRTIQDAANRLTGAERRKFEAQVARDFCQGSARKADAKGPSRVTWLMSNSRAPRRATRRVSGTSWPALGVNWSNCLWSSTALPASNRQLLQFTPKRPQE